MPRPDTLRGCLHGAPAEAVLASPSARAPWRDIAAHTRLHHDDIAGRAVLLRVRDQFTAAKMLVDLDGVASRIVIAPPDIDAGQLASVIASADIDIMVSDGMAQGVTHLRPGNPSPVDESAALRTEWALFTSGTTGAPKMALHDLTGLSGAIADAATPDVVWGTFYDIRRYGGLQIFLRAALGGASLILSDPDEAVADFLIRLGAEGVTHLTGTPSHWRRALMSPALSAIAPRYVRLSGEIADQAILDNLKRAFPDAAIGHAYASTEAGVGFEVTDGREGFPVALVGRIGTVEMKVVEGVLCIRSPRAARRFIGVEGVTDADGFVDTGDMVEKRGNRYYFIGRRGGIINVGGLKIHPEEVESVINRHPGVRLSRVSARRNPITGAIVVADVVLNPGADPDAVKPAILAACRASLTPFKVPAMLRFVPMLDLTPGGKLARAHA